MTVQADQRSAAELGIVGDRTEREIAHTTHVRHNAALGIDQIVIAGQPIPPDLVDAEEVKSDVATEGKRSRSAKKDE